MFEEGDKVKVTGIGWENGPPKGEQGTYTVASSDPSNDRCFVCFGKTTAHWGHGGEGIAPKKYLNKGYRFLWINNTQLVKITMMDKFQESGKRMAGSIGHGVAVAGAEEGVEFAYELICNTLHNQLGISMEKLQDKANREIIMALGVGLLHITSSVAEDVLPGMEHVQKGCELYIEGKSKEHSKLLFKHAFPMLLKASELMNPEKAMERLSKQVQKGLEETGLADKPAARVEAEVENEVGFEEVLEARQALREAEEAQTSSQSEAYLG